MRPSIFLGPEELDQNEVEDCLAAAVRLQDVIKKNPIDTVGRAQGVYRLLSADNAFVTNWAPREVEVFAVLDLTNLFHRLFKGWPWLPSYYSQGNIMGGPYSRVVLVNLVTATGEPTHGGSPLYWAQKLGYLECLGIRMLVPRESPPKEDMSLDERAHRANLEREKGAKKKVAVMFTVSPIEDDDRDGHRIVPSIDEGDGLLVGLVEDFPVTEYDGKAFSIVQAKGQIKRFCAQRREKGDEVTSAVVVTPDDCIVIDPTDGSEVSKTS